MGKNIKSYATTQVHFPREREEALRQKVQIFHLNMVRLNCTYWLNRTYYSLLKFTSKIFKLSPPVKFQRITQIPRNSPTQSTNSAKFAHFVNLFYIMFQAPAPTENAQEFQRIMQIPRSSPTQSANYAKFAPFANTTPYVSDAWPVAKNSLKIQRIKRNSLNSPNYPVNYANSTHFAVN